MVDKFGYTKTQTVKGVRAGHRSKFRLGVRVDYLTTLLDQVPRGAIVLQVICDDAEPDVVTIVFAEEIRQEVTNGEADTAEG